MIVFTNLNVYDLMMIYPDLNALTNNLIVSEADCTTLDQTWSNVVTVPALLVVHGTTLSLSCQEGYINLGGNTATCQKGQVVPTINPPDCRGKKIEAIQIGHDE